MVISGDVQLPWWQIADPSNAGREMSDPNCNSTACVKTKGIQMNENLIAAIASVQSTLKNWPNSSLLTKGAGSPITAPVGLIINGDLTAYFHTDEEELYRQFYHTQFTLPVYPGTRKSRLLQQCEDRDQRLRRAAPTMFAPIAPSNT